MACSTQTFEVAANSTQLWPQLFNHLSTAIYVKALNGSWLYANRASQQLWNHDPIDLSQPKHDSDCLPTDQLPHFSQADAQLMQQQSPVEFTSHGQGHPPILIRKSLFALTQAKHCILTECHRLPDNWAANPPSVLEDTLEELQHTQLQLVQHEKMSSLGQLMAGVAHEINNPVNFIYGNIRHAQSYTQELLELIGAYRTFPMPGPSKVNTLLKHIDLDFIIADLPKVLESMSVGAERIRTIVSSLRTFSRMDEAEMKTVDLHDGINSTVMILDHRFRGNDTRPAIDIQKQYDHLPLVKCYAGQLNQVFMNLLVNAVDAIEDAFEAGALSAPLTIKISTSIEDNQAIIAIHNDGPPIPKTIQPRLFDPFFTTKPVGQGTGIGLSLSYQIVHERHGGQILCTSTEQTGTTFTIQLPLTEPKKDAPLGQLQC